jgi:CBS domain-containing protein
MLKVRDVMTADVATVAPETTLRDAMELLTTLHVSGAPVIDHGEVVGVVSATDLLRFAATVVGSAAAEEPGEWADIEAPAESDELEGLGVPVSAYFAELWPPVLDDRDEVVEPFQRREWTAFDDHTVDDVMTRSLLRLSPDEDVESAARLMGREGVHRLLVMRDRELLGIVSTSDIARAVAARRLTP